MSRNISSPVLKEALQRISAEQIAISPDSLTKDELSTIIHKPQPEQKPVTNTETEQIRCLKSPDSIQGAHSDMSKKSNFKSVLEKKLQFSHSLPVIEQLPMHSVHSTNIAGKFQSSTQ